MIALIAMAIVGGVLIIGAVLFALDAIGAFRLAAAYRERGDCISHRRFDDLATARAQVAVVIGSVGMLVLWTVIARSM